MLNDQPLFIVNSANGQHLQFTTFATVKSPTGGTALWVYTPRSADDMIPMIVWLGERRAMWPKWRDLAQRNGSEAMDAAIAKLLPRSGLEPVISATVKRRDETTIAFEVTTPSRTLVIAEHRFDEASHANDFLNLLLGGGEYTPLFFVTTGSLIGPSQVNSIIDEIVETRIAGRPPRPGKGDVVH